MSRPVQPITRICVKPSKDGDGYLVVHGKPSAGIALRATPYGVRRVLADYGAVYSHRTKSGWHHYRCAAVEEPKGKRRRCRTPDCGKILPEDARTNRLYCEPACNWRHRRMRNRERAAMAL